MKALTYCLVLLTSLISRNLAAQIPEFVLSEKVVGFQEKTLKIPFLKASTEADQTYFGEINILIERNFNLVSNAPLDSSTYDEFVGSLGFYEAEVGFLDIDYKIELISNILQISQSGNYIQKEGSPALEVFLEKKERDILIDLGSKKILDLEKSVRLSSFFTPTGYLKFLCEKWSNNIKDYKRRHDWNGIGVEGGYHEENCINGNVFLATYSFEFKWTSGYLILYLTNAHFRDLAFESACNDIRMQIPISSLKGFLKPEAFQVLKAGKYQSQKSSLSKYLIYLNEIRPNNDYRFIFGSINNKYPIIMAINTNSKSANVGCYLYESNCQIIDLEGEFNLNRPFVLTEKLDGQITGYFNCNLTENGERDMIKGRKVYVSWMNPNREKIYKLDIDEVTL